MAHDEARLRDAGEDEVAQVHVVAVSPAPSHLERDAFVPRFAERHRELAFLRVVVYPGSCGKYTPIKPTCPVGFVTRMTSASIARDSDRLLSRCAIVGPVRFGFVADGVDRAHHAGHLVAGAGAEVLHALAVRLAQLEDLLHGVAFREVDRRGADLLRESKRSRTASTT